MRAGSDGAWPAAIIRFEASHAPEGKGPDTQLSGGGRLRIDEFSGKCAIKLGARCGAGVARLGRKDPAEKRMMNTRICPLGSLGMT